MLTGDAHKMRIAVFLHYLVSVLTAERAALQARPKPLSNAGMGDERIPFLLHHKDSHTRTGSIPATERCCAYQIK